MNGCTIVCFERKIFVVVVIVVAVRRAVVVMFNQKISKRFVVLLTLMLEEVMNKHGQLQKLMQFCICRQKNKEK